MTELGAEEARARLPELLDNAFFRDEVTIIKKRGVPYARLVPLAHYEQPAPQPPSMVQEPAATYAIVEDMSMPTTPANDLLERAAQLARELTTLLQPKPVAVNQKRAIDIARECNLIGLGAAEASLSSNYKAALANHMAEKYPAT